MAAIRKYSVAAGNGTSAIQLVIVTILTEVSCAGLRKLKEL
jgi:hypothetical protein